MLRAANRVIIALAGNGSAGTIPSQSALLKRSSHLLVMPSHPLHYGTRRLRVWDDGQ
jgi:hypothetical protein